MMTKDLLDKARDEINEIDRQMAELFARRMKAVSSVAKYKKENGLAVLPRYINSVLSLKVTSSVDLGSHMLFICELTEAKVISEAESMTYAYYHANVKPKPETKGKKGYVCRICGYVYEGEHLPENFICPLCKHGAADFEEIK
jgi:rubrerythrin